MNSLERVQTVLAGGIPDRVPVCLHNFMLAVREADVRMEDYRVDPEVIARVHLQAVEKYGYDCILVDTDTTMLAEALGARWNAPLMNPAASWNPPSTASMRSIN